ncbi:NAD(P)-dependent alcohol dehydrogenase [Chroococcidiopsis sp. FACHB-1243]|uniref:zinc-dependent alcohol dehydrogenase family protein n=1 Tax=Chroococcidiopsis sp. [FACHB-1243] TaxID=2692781 RepID=UPI001782C694|nr:NAD(P)-dependent alcohol dehydrogenase [Chroococcidiopsis sp. [FACHB-1243]]MBD2309659.1 NAD(P)-dependent alcohol dehydrogenase [Chroococcidiopsis sp. [FACHB-1243]]
MKAYEIQNDKPGLDALTLVERPQPQPRNRQVLIKMKAVSLNYRDLLVAKGAYGAKSFKPIVPLSDGAGEVVAVGEGVTRVRVGDRVAGIFMQTFISGELTAEKANSALGGAIDGVLAEYVVFDEQGVVKIPAHLSYEEAATLPCAAVTAWNAMIVEGQLKAGDTVLLQGTGGVSLFGLQFAKMMGARVILTSSSDDKLDRAIQLGADVGINYKTTSDWDEKVEKLTDGRGVDLVVEVGGSGTLSKSLRAVRYGGKVAMIGVLTGFTGDVSTSSILFKHIRVQGIYVGSRDLFEDMNRSIDLHQMKPIIDRVFPFHEARAALAYLESGAHFGKVCISL